MNDANVKSLREVEPLEEPSYANKTTEYSELIQDSAFQGDTPFETIKENIAVQFQDYINIEDPVNYVDVFYNQLRLSYKAAEDLLEDHPAEVRQVLDRIHEQFIEFMGEQFQTRLAITIVGDEMNNSSPEELEYNIRVLYNFFILNAKENFKTVITKGILEEVKGQILSDDEYFAKIDKLLEQYSPLITAVTPTGFLQYCNNMDILNLFNSGKVVGNFLRKYSPKLYQNEDFENDLINDITIAQQFGEDLQNGGE